MSSDPSTNPNPVCYEALASSYEAIYGQIDAKETVRQWWQLLVDAKLVVDPPGALRMVDIGCGPGWQVEAWRELGFTVVGLDSSPTLLASARERLADKDKQPNIYLADILDPTSLPVLRPFDLAVSHFNFLNLFDQKQREEVFRSVARLVRPGGLWITDFSEPRAIPASVEETIHLPDGILERKGQFNSQLGCYDQRWEGSVLSCVERFWFGHRGTVPSLALKTGWHLCLRKAWHPYTSEAAWHEPGEGDEVFVDVYQRIEGKKDELDHNPARVGALSRAA